MAAESAIVAGRTRSPAQRKRGRRTAASELQSGRLIAAVINVVGEVGFSQSTVAQLTSRARVSRKTFYDLFVDREDAFLVALQQETAVGLRLAREAYETQENWREGVRAGLERLLALLDERPAIARLCVVDALAGGPRMLQFRTELLKRLARVIDRGRDSEEARHDPPAITADVVTGGILSLLHTRICHEQDQPLSDLVGPLMSMIVLPYLGPRAARRELVRGPRKTTATKRSSWAGRDPLEGLGMRLTYRTVRALMVIAQSPGASNHQVSKGAGVVDQGQISKLLSRLARHGLIENFGGGQSRGLPNAWHLTERGTQLERLCRPR